MKNSSDTVKKIKFDGAVLHVEVSGPEDAPAILMWNGAFCSTRMWDMVVPKFENRYRVIRFDIRGTGQSIPSVDSTQYTLDQYADDASAIMDHLDVERAHIFAMAWGSRAALAFATLKPDKILKLALFDASIGTPDTEAQRKGREEAYAKMEAGGQERFEVPEGWNNNTNLETTRSALLAWRSFDLKAAASKLTIETMVATGDHDPNLASSQELVDRAAQAHLVVMKNVGHGSVLIRPDITAELFLNFIEN